jgi:hypothetical protein
MTPPTVTVDQATLTSPSPQVSGLPGVSVELVRVGIEKGPSPSPGGLRDLRIARRARLQRSGDPIKQP